MSFDRWYVLLFLPLLPLVWYFQVYKKKSLKIKYSAVGILKKLNATEQNLSLRKIFATTNVVILMLLIISVAGPKRGLLSKEESKRVVDIMLCLDTSTSMYALDFEPKNRFEVAADAAKEFVKLRKSDRLGIVVFSGVPVLQCPLTVDQDSVLRAIDNANIGMIKLDGTAIGSAIMLALSRLKEVESKTKIIILLTDGINNMGEISSGIVRQLLDLRENPEGKDILIVEDIVDTGYTLRYLKESILARKPRSVRVCVLLDKSVCRKVDTKIDYNGFVIPDKFVVGYGLDYNGLYRNLPYVAVKK